MAKYVIASKFDSTCYKCKGKVLKGDNVTPEEIDGKTRWVHLTCPKKGQKVSGLLQGINVPVAIDTEESLPAVLEAKEFIPSPFQQDAFDWAVYGEGNAVMKAVAGSGKTTTIVKMLDLLPRNIRILFVAFNKEIVRALVSKVRAAGYTNVTVKTLNAAGYVVVRKYEGFRDLRTDKVLDIMTEFWPISRDAVKDPVARSNNRVKRMAMKKIVEMVKATLTDYNSQEQVLELIEKYHIDVDEQMEQELIERLPYVMEKNNSDLEFVDFNDQCYLPVISPALQNKFDQYDFILCDEFQDFNRCNIEFIIKCLAPGGRVIAVGDQRQSIMGFRGADMHAIQDATERLNAKVLPLSISYRCPKSHVERVHHVAPEIQPAENAIEGVIEFLKYPQMLEKVKEGDMVLCRTNAPLVKPAFAVIKSGRKAIIKGKDIGRELVNYIERFQTDDLGHLDVLMQEHTEKEVERWLDKNKEMMADAIQERYQTITEVSKECTTVAQLITRITTLFSDDNIGVVFSSMHKSKGLEAQVIFQYMPELLPHYKAKTKDELEQEDNLYYVAGTRSLNELYLVSGEKE